jgi:hypothetical protein
MSENVKELKAVQQGIKDLIKKEIELKNKYEDGQLCNQERNELDGISKLLAALENDKRFWQGQVEKENTVVVPKPKVSFSKATMEDCTRQDGLNLNTDYTYIDIPTLHIPENIATPLPSDWLCETLKKIKQVWVLDNEKACRIVIDAILTEVLLNDKDRKLLGFCEVKNDWEGSGFGYTGDVDYMLGTSKIRSVNSMDSFLLVLEAKKEWPDSAIPQILCEAGCLLKKRLAVNKNTPVFAVLTNSLLFRFFAIDVNGVVYTSGNPPIGLGPGTEGGYTNSSSLYEILRWFAWFMTSIKSISPRASSEDLTETNIENTLSDLKSCFGLKPVTLNKKFKTK